MSRIKTISIICLLFLTTFVFTSFGRSQTTTNSPTKAEQVENEQTMRALLNEVRQLRLAIQRSNLSAYHAQVIIERMRSQRQHVDRLTDRLRETRDRMASMKMGQTEIQYELKKMEDHLSQQTDVGVIRDVEEQIDRFKNRLGAQAQEEARLRENESQLVGQLQIEQSRLTEFNDQLDALQRELEKPPLESKPPQGGKRP